MKKNKQRKGKVPTTHQVGRRYTKGLEELKEAKVATTHSGLMTQEVFFLYAKHFVKSLPVNHKPVLLLLDGHRSCWSVPALNLLLQNEIYLFFLASHMSIWSQPNDCGINKHFHWSLEQSVKSARREKEGSPNVAYFNSIFTVGWK